MLVQCDSNEHPHWTRSTPIPTSCPGSISMFAASISIVCWLQSQIYSSEFIQTCDFRDLLLADMSVSIIHGHTFATNRHVLRNIASVGGQSMWIPLSPPFSDTTTPVLRHKRKMPGASPSPSSLHRPKTCQKSKKKKGDKMDVEGIKHLNPMLVRWMYQTCCKKEGQKGTTISGCLRWSSQGEHHDSSWQKCVFPNIPHKKWLKSATRFHLNPQLMEIICSWSMLKKIWPVHQLWTLQAAKEKCYMWKKNDQKHHLL